MVSINYATREVSCKIVFYGPGLSGKTTNLQYVHAKVPSETKGKLISLATDADRTLYFDFLPINIGSINGFAAKFQLYTVPGQVYYNATRKLVLRGTDGLVFVADSQPDKMDENIESLNNLKENMAEYGYDIAEVPIVIQYNKQDLPGVSTVEEMRPILNPAGWPEFRASATEGFGVFDTLKCILKLVLDKAKTGGTPSKSTAVKAAVTQPPPSPPPPPVSPAPVTPSPMPSVTQPSPIPPSQQEAAPVATDPFTGRPTKPVPVAPAATSQTAVPQQAVPSFAQPEPTITTTPVSVEQAAPQTESKPPELIREPVPPQSVTVNRPFPGNTTEQEENMKSNHGYAATPEVPSEAPETDGDDASGDSPAMAPSLKADKPRQKRSFFKRLFGLK